MNPQSQNGDIFHDDRGIFDFSAFDGISVRSISFPGTLPALTGLIRTSGPNQIIENVTLDDALPVKIQREKYGRE